MELKHLELHYFTFPTLTSFKSFPKLFSLELISVNFHSGTVWEFVAGCPILDYLKMDRSTTNEMRLRDLAILSNVKKLNLSFGV